MSRDNWERLVEATLKREKLREIALCPSFSSSTSSDFSFDSSCQHVSAPYKSLMISPISYYGLRYLDHEEIRKATRNFRRDLCLGESVFGVIFKGWIREDALTAAKRCMWMLSCPQTAVAIKEWKQDDRAVLGSWPIWLMELKYLSQLDHPNVIKLIGYCSEGDNLVFVYEFLCKGSLQSHLITNQQQLSWDTRIKVAICAARGLSFLHDREMPVIHRNINANSIHLDVDFNAKLGGFFLAEDGPVNDHTSSMSSPNYVVAGTSGFVAPEYLATGQLTTKYDVYAFGVVLLQILSGRDISDLRWVKPYLNVGVIVQLSQIMDTKLNGKYPRNAALAVLRLAFQCLNSDPEHRPQMSEVLVVLKQL